MVEISADPQIAVSSRLVVTSLFGARRAIVEVPAVTSDSLIAAGETAYLQGWSGQVNQAEASYHIINLGTAQASCVTNLRRPGGLPIINASNVRPPLSQWSVRDIQQTLGVPSAQDTNLAVFLQPAVLSLPHHSLPEWRDGLHLAFRHRPIEPPASR